MAYDTSRPGTTQAVAYTNVAANSAALGSQTRRVRLCANSACHYLVTAAGTSAQTSDKFLPALWVEYISVNPGEIVSAIRASTNGLVTATSGSLWVTELD